jgi:hypothetical protein
MNKVKISIKPQKETLELKSTISKIKTLFKADLTGRRRSQQS